MMRSIREYHDGTSYDRLAMGGHFLDWGNQPDVYKHYPGAKRIPLPDEMDLPQPSLWGILCQGQALSRSGPVTLKDLARLLLLSYSRTARSRHPGGDFHYRSVPSAGALYPCELYVGVREVSGLAPGLYHYAIRDYSLTTLREGDVLGDLYDLPSAGPRDLPGSVFFVTAVSFRSAWKYRDRAYRYHLLDAGHLLEGISLALMALGLQFRLDYDFDDAATNALLGLDGKREFCLAVIRVGGGAAQGSASGRTRERLSPMPASSPVAPREIDHPAIGEAHFITSRVQGRPERDPEIPLHLGLTAGPWRPLPGSHGWPEIMNLPQAVWRRRSKRNFVDRGVSEQELDSLLTLLCAADPEVVGGTLTQDTVGVGFLAGKVEGLEPGLYILDRGRALMAMSSPRPKVAQMAHVCLDQEWLAKAALHFLFMSDLDLLERGWGPRGYRYAMMTAGRLAHRIYLGSTAMGLGCCGIGALYDGEASQLLGLNASSRLLYLVAAGPVKR